ncbi:hypothetical protein LY76DRAFT_103811 [Colletotrichum caudatum]|nr:hypothetical protein LY76DRAFT_103811 [Colletotrichum caudatum]
MHSVDTSACVQIYEFSTQDRTRGRLSTPRRSHVDRQTGTYSTHVLDLTQPGHCYVYTCRTARIRASISFLLPPSLPLSLSHSLSRARPIRRYYGIKSNRLYLAKAPRGTDCSTQTFASETRIAIRSPFITHPSEPVSSPGPLSWTIHGLFRCTHTYTPFTGPSPPSKLGTHTTDRYSHYHCSRSPQEHTNYCARSSPTSGFCYLILSPYHAALVSNSIRSHPSLFSRACPGPGLNRRNRSAPRAKFPLRLWSFDTVLLPLLGGPGYRLQPLALLRPRTGIRSLASALRCFHHRASYSVQLKRLFGAGTTR